jgi:hypothetical protein
MKKLILPLLVAVTLASNSSLAKESLIKDFYHPADKFPKNVIGIKIIGKFKATDTLSEGNVLHADWTLGEKDNNRFFIFTDGNSSRLQPEEHYIFTEKNPLVVSEVQGLGWYGVTLQNADSLSQKKDSDKRFGKNISSGSQKLGEEQPTTASVNDSDQAETGKQFHNGIKQGVDRINYICNHFNDDSLIREIEQGKKVSIDLPSELTNGCIELLPKSSVWSNISEKDLSPKYYTCSALFKDSESPVYYVYVIENNPENLDGIFLKQIQVMNLNEIDFRQCPEGIPRGQIIADLNNSYGMYGITTGISTDLLSPMYRSYNKFTEWEKIAKDKNSSEFIKQIPTGEADFIWQNEGVAGIAAMLPYPRIYKDSHYRGYQSSEIQKLMRAFYFYQSARNQIELYINNQISKAESSKKEIEDSFK